PPTYRRKIRLPILLFLATCFSTFFVGAHNWLSLELWTGNDFMLVRRVVLHHWADGMWYMACLMTILLSHEFGHFLMTVRYGIAATFPIFIPMPIKLGTMGAVIAMDGSSADKKETFDIGIAGPLAGLVFAIPI